jgi:phosphomannomutase
MAEPIISVSGLRGIVGESLTPDVAARYVAAFAETLPPGPVIVGRDGRTTGPMLALAVQSSLAAMGRDVLYADIAATPTLGVLVRAKQAAGGVQITASHNPPPYNGLKLFSGEGRILTAAAGQPVLERYRSGTFRWAPFDRVGQVRPLTDTTSNHLRLLSSIVNADNVARRRFRVLLDSNAGSGSILGRKLLEELDCDVIAIGDQPTGQFLHPPEPTAANLQSIGAKVVEHGAAIGFCQDPDADRLAIIDERGQYIGEEYTLAMCVDHVLRHDRGPVVTNCATSRMTLDLAEEYGVPFSRSAVGEANVVDEMLRQKAVFGGEGSGGPIDPRVGLVRDSFVGMALVLAGLAERGEALSRWVASLPKYEIHKVTLQLDARKLPDAFAAVESRFPEATADRLDGLRLDWPDRWLIVRGSNTEPIVRVIAEAPTLDDAKELCDQTSHVLQSL